MQPFGTNICVTCSLSHPQDAPDSLYWRQYNRISLRGFLGSDRLTAGCLFEGNSLHDHHHRASMRAVALKVSCFVPVQLTTVVFEPSYGKSNTNKPDVSLSTHLASSPVPMSPKWQAPPSLHASTALSSSSYATLPSKPWVDLAPPPNQGGDTSNISGNAPRWIKQLNDSVFARYGVGHEDCFAHAVGKRVKFVEVNVDQYPDRHGRLEASTVAEVIVSKGIYSFPNHLFSR